LRRQSSLRQYGNVRHIAFRCLREICVVVMIFAVAGTPAPVRAGSVDCLPECDSDGSLEAGDAELLSGAVFNDGAGCADADFNGDGAIAAADFASLVATLGTQPWIPLPPIAGGKRQEHAVAALDGKIYVVGGFITPPGTQVPLITDAVEAYDVATRAWETVAPLPLEIHHVAAVPSGGKLYVIGGLQTIGFTPIDTLYEYDPAEDEWTRRQNLPARRGAMAAAEIDGLLYAVGGLISSSTSTTRHEVYDPIADEWTELAPLPSPRNHLAAGVIDGKLYAVGGRTGSNTAELDRYDPATNEWEVLPPMPTARGGLVAAVVNGRLIVAGGEFFTGGTGVNPEVEMYDPIADEWMSLDPMAVPRHGMGAAAVGDLMYVPGGGIRAQFAATEYFDALCLTR
jgi:N-acetylneuraminic acid mutarotase